MGEDGSAGECCRTKSVSRRRHLPCTVVGEIRKDGRRSGGDSHAPCGDSGLRGIKPCLYIHILRSLRVATGTLGTAYAALLGHGSGLQPRGGSLSTLHLALLKKPRGRRAPHVRRRRECRRTRHCRPHARARPPRRPLRPQRRLRRRHRRLQRPGGGEELSLVVGQHHESWANGRPELDVERPSASHPLVRLEQWLRRGLRTRG